MLEVVGVYKLCIQAVGIPWLVHISEDTAASQMSLDSPAMKENNSNCAKHAIYAVEVILYALYHHPLMVGS